MAAEIADHQAHGSGRQLQSLRQLVHRERPVENTEFDVTPCMVRASPAEAETEIRDLLANQSFDLVMVGGAVRAFPEHTLLFERIINVIVDAAPGIRFCFNTSPETSLDALRRAAASV
ncbi:hypothetical protein [Nocardia carnea]|uniref:hypothetical protein n=1 Tax=Nocardia carnea TaxID=37328 RepID=UPI002454716C|nr:hypothetical protein [Nocardia carnea]